MKNIILGVICLMICTASFAGCRSSVLNGELTFQTSGQKFYQIQSKIEEIFKEAFKSNPKICRDGILYLFLMHTSAAIGITESSDEEAKTDIMNFLDKIAPRGEQPGVSYLHSLEGPDDSPSHLKSIILNQSLVVPVAKGNLDLGKWQNIYLMEFRDQSKTRTIKFKYKAD